LILLGRMPRAEALWPRTVMGDIGHTQIIENGRAVMCM
jgi:hypothetical protein